MDKRKRIIRSALPLALFLLLAALLPPTVYAGGWATITVIELPHTVQMAEPMEVEFVVRQHGRHPLADLSPVVRAQRGSERVIAHAEAGDYAGHYRATLILPQAGTWSWQVEAFTMEVEMPPLTVEVPATFWESPLGQLVALLQIQQAGEEPSPAAFGRDLFVAKGCVTCHAHNAISGYRANNLGPDLSDYTPNPAYVHVWLRNAAELTADNQWPMPTLELTDGEIEALIAFLAEEAQP